MPCNHRKSSIHLSLIVFSIKKTETYVDCLKCHIYQFTWRVWIPIFWGWYSSSYPRDILSPVSLAMNKIAGTNQHGGNWPLQPPQHCAMKLMLNNWQEWIYGDVWLGIPSWYHYLRSLQTFVGVLWKKIHKLFALFSRKSPQTMYH